MSNLVKTKRARNDAELPWGKSWDTVPWPKVNDYVSRLQYRIYKASRENDLKKVFKLQKILLQSHAARLLAVKIVTTRNKGKNTAGVERQMGKMTTNKVCRPFIQEGSEKYLLAMRLKLDGKAESIRRFWREEKYFFLQPKPGQIEKRPLGISIIEDRAKQALAKLVLEPQWEAKFEPNSYGFRPGRSCHDAIEAIFLSLHHNVPKWVYDADIRKFFDRINHEALLNKLCTFPLMRRQVSAWLKAGIMEGYANEPKNRDVIPRAKQAGTPQGGVISPILANIALHGLEDHLKTFVESLPKPHPGANRGKVAKRKAISIVRYADDFVLIHRNKEILEACVEETKHWLQGIGLEINEEKSLLRDVREGFIFLGFQIIQVKKLKTDRYKTKIVPSKQKRLAFLRHLREVIQKNKATSAYHLIQMLRPKIIGWANFYRFCECKNVFSSMTDSIFRKLRAWAFRRSRKGRRYWKEKFFPSGRTYSFKGKTFRDNWIFVGSTTGKDGEIKENFLPHIVWVPSEKYVKVYDDESPYSRSPYWILRSRRYSSWLPTRIGTLFRRQKGNCSYCQKSFSFSDMQNWEVDHIIPRASGGPDTYENIQLLHRACHVQKTKEDQLKYRKTE
jgi:group II intron reverse transcriptase/maturase